MDQIPAPTAEPAAQSTGPDFVKIEHEIGNFWREHSCFEKLQAQLRGKPMFRFLDGPITANNPMGVHHAMGRSLKDIILRYKSARGLDCHFQNGFDCQGLWVEVEVEKELGFRGKPDIEAFGLDKFSEACKERVRKFSTLQTEQSIRLGQWMDWDHSYYTSADKNIEGIWAFLKTCHANGWLYQSGLPMPWCTRCGTSLSEHEMSGSYKTVKHLSVYLKLKLPALGARILVWTTTPWTLAANTALAVNPELEYALVEVEGEELPLILSHDVLKSWGSKFNKKEAKVLRTMPGTALLGLEYEPIMPELPAQQGFSHKVVGWDQVDPQEGTGVVHIAPGCGLEDFQLAQTIELVQLTPIDEKGDYVNGYGFLVGKNAQQVALEVAEYLSKNGKLLSKYHHEHSYPVCWRCKTELVFRLVEEWYISTKEIRPQLIEAAKTVVWQPEHIGKRMEDWLRNMGDWCISRKRFWGLPLPFYPCPKCETLTVAGSKEELQKLTDYDVSKVPELHRPWIDEVKIKCPRCQSEAPRVTEVGDCWLDAGIVSYTTAGCYGQSGEWAPADWISEMSEQVRLWFYSVLFMGVTLRKQAPYKKVSTYEKVTAEDGSKFSKTGYMIKFDEAAERMGVDTMRYYFASQPPTNDMRFGFGIGDETRRQLISLWNVFSFFKTYAELDKPDFSKLTDPEKKLTSTDRWLLASLYEFATHVEEAYENYSVPAVVREFESFLDGISNWYIRSNRRRFWKSEASEDKLVGYWSLFQVLKVVTRMMGPVIPFVCDKIWQDCVRRFDPQAELSVHLAPWPTVPKAWAAPESVKKVSQVRQVINLGHRLRAESGVKVRQPLGALYLAVPEAFQAACKEMAGVILSELNVKELKFISEKREIVSEYLELDMKKAGPVLKGDLGKVVPTVNALTEAQAAALAEKIRRGEEVTLPAYPQALPAGIFIVKTRSRAGLVSAEEFSLFVALNTTVTKELEQEGWIREILRGCQVLRKDSGLEVQDRINLRVRTESPELRTAIDKQKALIEEETLGVLVDGDLESPAGTRVLKLPGGEVEIALARRG